MHNTVMCILSMYWQRINHIWEVFIISYLPQWHIHESPVHGTETEIHAHIPGVKARGVVGLQSADPRWAIRYLEFCSRSWSEVWSGKMLFTICIHEGFSLPSPPSHTPTHVAQPFLILRSAHSWQLANLAWRCLSTIILCFVLMLSDDK